MDDKKAKELYIEYLKEIKYSEEEAKNMLAQLSTQAESPELKAALQMTEEQAMPQMKQIEMLFSEIEEKPATEKDKVTETIMQDGEEKISKAGEGPSKDIAIAGGLIRLKHYLMACYEVTATLAESIKQKESAKKLMAATQQTQETAKKFGKVANNLAMQGM